jgi:MFS family permease
MSAARLHGWEAAKPISYRGGQKARISIDEGEHNEPASYECCTENACICLGDSIRSLHGNPVGDAYAVQNHACIDHNPESILCGYGYSGRPDVRFFNYGICSRHPGRFYPEAIRYQNDRIDFRRSSGNRIGHRRISGFGRISVWFPLHNRALPTGLWATSVGIGNIVMFLTASNMAVKFGWQAVWWAGAGFAALSFILFAILFRMPKPEEMETAPAPPSDEKPPSLIKGMANVSFWMVAVAFGVYNLVVMAMISFLPQFLEFERGYSLTFENGALMNAGFVTALVMAVSVISAPGGGYISDRLGTRKIMVLIPYILMTLTFFFPFTVTGSIIPVYMIVFGLVGGPIAPVLLAAVPEVAKKPQYIGIGMGVAALGQNLGVYLGTSQFPRIQAAVGWEAAGYWMIPICLIGIIATLCIKVR